jgi:hypothetical protein
VAGVGVVGFAQRADGAATRAWLSAAKAVVVIGARVEHGPTDRRPLLRLDADEDEPLAARAFRIGERLAALDDAIWLAAIGLPWLSAPEPSHPLIEQAFARHRRGELVILQALLEAAIRGPDAGATALFAIEQLTAARDPAALRASPAGQLLARTADFVRAEAVRASHLRPRAGGGVLVVEYDSPCRVEDLVAERWRRLRAGTVVLAANHGVVADRVCVAARAATSEALDPLRPLLDEHDQALMTPEAWAQLLARLDVPAAPPEPLGVARDLSSSAPN